MRRPAKNKAQLDPPATKGEDEEPDDDQDDAGDESGDG